MRGSSTRGGAGWSGEELEGEDLIEDLGSVLNDIGKYAQKALPGALQGAMTGASVGGPWGALLGGVAGAGSSLLGSPAAAVPPAGVSPTQIANAPQVPGLQGLITNPAALQLVLSLLKPEVLQGLLGLAVQGPQAPPVRVGQTQVPVAAFANLVQSLSERALAIHHAAGGAEQGSPTYAEHLGAARAAMPDARADALLTLLANSERPPPRRAVVDDPYDDPADMQDLIDIYRYGDLD